MKTWLRTTLLFLPVLSLLPACFVSGGTESPLRFLFFPLMAFFSLYFPSRHLHAAGLIYTVLFPLLIFFTAGVTPRLPLMLAEISAFFFCTLVAGFISRQIHQERFRYENAIATFHGLSNALNHKNMNLQTTLDALSEAHRKLQDFDKTKTEFISNISHELRTPLSSIRSYSEILLNYSDIEPETQREFLQTINAESERLSLFVTEILDLIRIESGKREVVFASVSSEELLVESERVVRPMALEKGLAVRLEKTKALPDVMGEKNQLIQVLVNLLNNAVKFTKSGEISLGARVREDFVEFYVSDTGEGIFPEEQEVIFQPFTRIAEHGSDRPKGSGLGLSISKGIVEFHGGRIWVESEVGEGSTFFFTIPMAKKKVQSLEQLGQGIQDVETEPYRSILVVTPDTVSRRNLREKLEDVGYRTLGADSFALALDIMETMRPGLVVTEVPEDPQGFEELVRRAREAGTGVILTTLYIHAGEEPSLAVHGYISKPFDKYQILSLLGNHKLKRGTIMLVSPDREESRTLQVILGAAGFETTLFHDGASALNAGESTPPDAVFVGTFQKEDLEEIFGGFRSFSKTGLVPVFQIIGMTLNKYVRPVTLGPVNHKSEAKSLYRLIGEIEKEYSKGLE